VDRISSKNGSWKGSLENIRECTVGKKKKNGKIEIETVGRC
jgi:hypothetical protein